MQFGVCLPHRWKYASAQLIADVAQEAESLRFDSVWVTDHVIVPVHHVERGHIFYEALMTLAFVSSITRTVALGTTVLATPTRNPVVLAREVATLDALSGGRVILGVGTGWIREELEAVGVAWTERGRFLDHPDECIDCGACEPVCPVTAIFVEDETPEQWKHFIALNKQFFVDNPAVKPCTTKN